MTTASPARPLDPYDPPPYPREDLTPTMSAEELAPLRDYLRGISSDVRAEVAAAGLRKRREILGW